MEPESSAGGQWGTLGTMKARDGVSPMRRVNTLTRVPAHTDNLVGLGSS